MSDPDSALQGESVHDPHAGDEVSYTEHGGPPSGADDQIRKDAIDPDAGKAKGDDQPMQMGFREAMDIFKTPQKLEEAVRKRGLDANVEEELQSPRDSKYTSSCYSL